MFSNPVEIWSNLSFLDMGYFSIVYLEIGNGSVRDRTNENLCFCNPYLVLQHESQFHFLAYQDLVFLTIL